MYSNYKTAQINVDIDFCTIDKIFIVSFSFALILISKVTHLVLSNALRTILDS